MNPTDVLRKAIGQKKAKEPICELVERVFTTRNLLHFAHLSTQSYAAHNALGELYDSIVDTVDEIAEVYMGKFGLLKGLKCVACDQPADIIRHIQDEAQWVEDNRSNISKGYTPIENLIDTLIGNYSRTVYKLQNLK